MPITETGWFDATPASVTSNYVLQTTAMNDVTETKKPHIWHWQNISYCNHALSGPKFLHLSSQDSTLIFVLVFAGKFQSDLIPDCSIMCHSAK